MTCTALHITLQGFSHSCQPVRTAKAFLILLRKSDPPPKRVMNFYFFPVPQTVKVIDQVRSDWILLPILSHLSGFFFLFFVFLKVTSFSQSFLKTWYFSPASFCFSRSSQSEAQGTRPSFWQRLSPSVMRKCPPDTIETCMLHNTYVF